MCAGSSGGQSTLTVFKRARAAATAVMLLLLVVMMLGSAAGRVFERCELARELRHRHALPKQHIATWVCIARHESEYNTSARNYASGDHGLFQISELWWCGSGGDASGACGLPCSALRDDDISDDVTCARRVHREHTRLSGDGFNAWVVYPQHCQHNVERYTEGCFDDVENLVGRYQPTTTIPTTTAIISTTARAKAALHYKLTTQKSTTRATDTKNNIHSREIRKLPHKFIEHSTGSRYKYNINKSGFALFKEN